MRKFTVAASALAAIFLFGVPAVANAATGSPATPADPVWSLYETHITLDDCNFDGQSLEASGQTTDYTCDAGDNGQEDGFYALWILVDE